MKKRIFFGLIVLFIAFVGWNLSASPDVNALKEGDMVFQTTHTSQSMAILVASTSPYTHVGMLRKRADKWVVVEASATVKETPWQDWLAQGVGQRVAIYRDSSLSAEKISAILAEAEKYYGKKYDIFFSFDNDELYCSELPYLAFKSQGITIGKVQKIAELNVKNDAVQSLIKERIGKNPVCKTKGLDANACYDYVLEQSLITPASIAKDAQFQKVFSNYPL